MTPDQDLIHRSATNKEKQAIVTMFGRITFQNILGKCVLFRLRPKVVDSLGIPNVSLSKILPIK